MSCSTEDVWRPLTPNYRDRAPTTGLKLFAIVQCSLAVLTMLNGYARSARAAEFDGPPARFQLARVFADELPQQDDRHVMTPEEKYKFRAVGVIDGGPESAWVGSFVFVGNCHTAVTAGHVVFNRDGILTSHSFRFLPGGEEGPEDRTVHLQVQIDPHTHKEKIISHNIIYYSHHRWYANDTAAFDYAILRLPKDVPDCGAFTPHVASSRFRKRFLQGGIELIAAAGDADFQPTATPLIVRHCSILNPFVDRLGFVFEGLDTENLIFDDCDFTPGASGGAIVTEVNHQVYFFGLNIGAVSVQGKPSLPSYFNYNKSKFVKSQNSPNSPHRYIYLPNAYRLEYPNIAIRLRAPIFEDVKHFKWLPPDERAQEIREEKQLYPFAWDILRALKEWSN